MGTNPLDKEKAREYSKRYYYANKVLCSQRRQDYRKRNPERNLWYKAKARAKSEGYAFNIEIDDIVIPDTCPILGILLVPGQGKVTESSPSLDKVDPSKGYTKGNVRVISHKANSYKRDMSFKDIEALFNYMKNNS